MFSLLYGLYQMYFEKPTYRVLMVGLDGAGKTTLLEQIKSTNGQKSMPLNKIPPTIGLNIAKVDRQEGEYVVWDVGG